MPALFLPLPFPIPTANLSQTGIGGQTGCSNSLPTTLSKIGNHSSRSPSPELEAPISCLPAQKLMTRPPSGAASADRQTQPNPAAQNPHIPSPHPSRHRAPSVQVTSPANRKSPESTPASNCANAPNHALPLAAATHPVPPSTQSHQPIRPASQSDRLTHSLTPNQGKSQPLKSHAIPYPGIVQRSHLTPIPPVPPPPKNSPNLQPPCR